MRERKLPKGGIVPTLFIMAVLVSAAWPRVIFPVARHTRMFRLCWCPCGILGETIRWCRKNAAAACRKAGVQCSGDFTPRCSPAGARMLRLPPKSGENLGRIRNVWATFARRIAKLGNRKSQGRAPTRGRLGAAGNGHCVAPSLDTTRYFLGKKWGPGKRDWSLQATCNFSGQRNDVTGKQNFHL